MYLEPVFASPHLHLISSSAPHHIYRLIYFPCQIVVMLPIMSWFSSLCTKTSRDCVYLCIWDLYLEPVFACLIYVFDICPVIGLWIPACSLLDYFACVRLPSGPCLLPHPISIFPLPNFPVVLNHWTASSIEQLSTFRSFPCIPFRLLDRGQLMNTLHQDLLFHDHFIRFTMS